jgi:multicomponent Na+:H+ antiporter subunit C
MSLVLAVTLGFLFASGLYLILRRSMVKLIIGIVLLAHAVNLLLFLMGRLVPGEVPLIAEGVQQLTGNYADPLPQALILTAIVIGFGLQIFAIVLISKVYQAVNSDDTMALSREEDGSATDEISTGMPT